jgi:hypothetical protein
MLEHGLDALLRHHFTRRTRATQARGADPMTGHHYRARCTTCGSKQRHIDVCATCGARWPSELMWVPRAGVRGRKPNDEGMLTIAVVSTRLARAYAKNPRAVRAYLIWTVVGISERQLAKLLHTSRYAVRRLLLSGRITLYQALAGDNRKQ